MADREEEDLRMALRMSMQNSLPEPKRSKPRDGPAGAPAEEPSEVKTRRLQRELMAAAAEKRMLDINKCSPSASASPSKVLSGSAGSGSGLAPKVATKDKELSLEEVNLGKGLSEEDAKQLFSMVFGPQVTKGILVQWSNQGISMAPSFISYRNRFCRTQVLDIFKSLLETFAWFSADPETSMGLVQHEGGPCGVLAAIQAFVLKYLLFYPAELGKVAPNMHQNTGSRTPSNSQRVASNNFASLTEDAKASVLIRSMGEILFLCGSNKRAVIATLSVIGDETERADDNLNDEVITKSLEGLSIESAADLHKVLRVSTYTTQESAFQRLQSVLPVFQSRMGALLFLISALLSRGLDLVQSDRDDPGLPLVTAPFGHASQEIVNLLLCGQAVPNVFDGKMDLGGGMSLKGISKTVEVGFLTLLESLNFCKVGQYLKSPKWPIWVVGSESHYTVLFSLDTTVQDENELEGRESQIRRAFDAQDQSGGGGFISVEGFHQVLRETNINLPTEKVDLLCNTGFIVWSELWQVILDLDKSLGGLKDSTGLMGKKVFDLYHFNGIAKSDLNGSQTSSGGEIPVQRPRLTKLRVSVPPRWTPEEYMTDVVVSSASSGNESGGKATETAKPEPAQHAPLVDCIRTRWPRAVCNWVGDPPSIV